MFVEDGAVILAVLLACMNTKSGQLMPIQTSSASAPFVDTGIQRALQFRFVDTGTLQ